MIFKTFRKVDVISKAELMNFNTLHHFLIEYLFYILYIWVLISYFRLP